MEIAIDILKIFERLKSADPNEKAAKEIAEVIRDVSLESQKGLTTKGDISRLEIKLTERIALIEDKLKLIKLMLSVVGADIISLIVKAFFTA